MDIQKLDLLYTPRILPEHISLKIPVKNMHYAEGRINFVLRKPFRLEILYAMRMNYINYDTSNKLFHMIHIFRFEVSEFFDNFMIIGEMAFDYYSDDYKLFSNEYDSNSYFTPGSSVSASYKVSDRTAAVYNIQKIFWRLIPFVAARYNYTKDIYRYQDYPLFHSIIKQAR